MKVEIITIHRLNNFGSAFQAMALYQYIKEMGLDVEILDYHPSYYRGSTLRNYVGRLLYHRILKEREQKFDTFIETYTQLSSKRYTTITELRNSPPYADLYIAGGDQLWNFHHLCGNDDAYKLMFWQGNKISYGTSMGGKLFSDVQLHSLREKIYDFKYLSLRESHSVKQLRDLGLNAAWVVDPVMLLPAERYIRMMKLPAEKDRYVFVYLVAPSKLLDNAVAYFKNVCGYKVIVYSGLAHKCKCDTQKRALGPEEVIGYINNAEFILSSSFHATVFSIMFQKKFSVILPGEETNERIYDLLSWTNMQDTIIKTEKDIEKTLYKQQWYTAENEEVIRSRVDASKQYLDTAIRGCM